MRLFLGVDGGQSSTMALIADESGRVIGSGRGGPCNHVKGPEGYTKFVNAIRGCLEAACAEAGLSPDGVRFEAACLGFSGGPSDKQAILESMIPADRLIVTHDALIALVGATAGQPGIITIAGTGSIAFGRNADDETARAGGWGYIFGDEGGGFDLTRQALRAALRFEEGWGQPTILREMLLKETGAESANDLLHRFYTTDYPRPQIASYSRLVDEAATAGDRVALDILSYAAQQLAQLTGAVRQQLFEEGEEARVAYIGGVFRSQRLLQQYRMLVELEDGNHVGPPEYEPAAGALLEAFRRAGVTVRLTNLPEREK
ncbi:MAG: ATPase [Bryobacteraceae bacterium]|nr:ATPase [Bryobacteraceae bacterium]